jgi:hypothetical protein
MREIYPNYAGVYAGHLVDLCAEICGIFWAKCTAILDATKNTITKRDTSI